MTGGPTALPDGFRILAQTFNSATAFTLFILEGLVERGMLSNEDALLIAERAQRDAIAGTDEPVRSIAVIAFEQALARIRAKCAPAANVGADQVGRA